MSSSFREGIERGFPPDTLLAAVAVFSQTKRPIAFNCKACAMIAATQLILDAL
jgi:hypothetical protein